MKPLSEWTSDDLHQLVRDGIPESLTLEYKASESLQNNNVCRNELSKDISAFANSAGGRIIYGIVEEDHTPQRVDHGVPTTGVTREWIEQIINSNIQPRIRDLVIHPVPLESGGTAYIIDIPQATAFAPHQANDKKYYKRFNFASEAMADYEIKDILGRASTPAPDVWFEITPAARDNDQDHKMTFSAFATNLSDEPILYARILFAFERRFLGLTPPIFANLSYRESSALVGDGKVEDVSIVARNIMPPNHMPIWRGNNWNLFEVVIDIPLNGRYHFQKEFSCPGYSSREAHTVEFIDGAVELDLDETGFFRAPRGGA